MEHDPNYWHNVANQGRGSTMSTCLHDAANAHADLIERSRLQAVYIKDMENTLATFAKSMGMDKPDADKLIERHAKLQSEHDAALIALKAERELAGKLATAFWRLTKNMDMGELADYDSELAADTKEMRAVAHEMTFGIPHSDALAAKGDGNG